MVQPLVFSSIWGKDILGLFNFQDEAIWRNEIDRLVGDDKFAFIHRAFQVRVLSDRSLICLAGFLEIAFIGVGMGMEGCHNILILKLAVGMRRETDTVLSTCRPASHTQVPILTLKNKAPFFMPTSRFRPRISPSLFQGGTDEGVAQEATVLFSHISFHSNLFPRLPSTPFPLPKIGCHCCY